MTRSPWVRGALVLLVVSFLALGGLRGARVWTEKRFGRELGSLEPGAYTRPPVKSDANAARYFLAASGKLRVEPEEARSLAAWAGDPASPPDPLVGLLGKNEASVRLARQGAGLADSFYGVDYASGFRASLPDLPQLLVLGRLLSLEARLAQERGEKRRFHTALATLGSLAASLEREPGVTLFHAGLGLERLQLQVLALALETRGFLGNDLQELTSCFSAVPLEAVYRRVVGLEEASLRRELPQQTGLASLGASDFWRYVSARKALKLAAFATLPCARWSEEVPWERLPNHETRLLLTLAQAQGVAASRVLLQGAVSCLHRQGQEGDLPASLGFFPEGVTGNPFTGQPLAYDPVKGTLAVPDGNALWNKLKLSSPPPFAVALKASERAAGRASTP